MSKETDRGLNARETTNEPTEAIRSLNETEIAEVSGAGLGDAFAAVAGLSVVSPGGGLVVAAFAAGYWGARAIYKD